MPVIYFNWYFKLKYVQDVHKCHRSKTSFSLGFGVSQCEDDQAFDGWLQHITQFPKIYSSYLKDSLTKEKIDWLKKYHMQETQTLQFCCIGILDIDMKSPRALSCKANMFSAKPP